jgi:hypothetical protein
MKEKTIEDVRLHCMDNGYTKEDMGKICSFLYGKGLKHRKETIRFLVGDGTFDDFMDWFDDIELPPVGNYIHTKDGGNYKIITSCGEKIVVIDADANAKVLNDADVERLCTAEEIIELYEGLMANGLIVCPDCERLEATSDLDLVLGNIEELEEANPNDEDMAGVVESLRNLCTWLDMLETDEENKYRIVSILEDLAMYVNGDDEE